MGYAGLTPPSAAVASVPPSPMVSTAEEGTITIEPFSLMASYSMFMARRCRATGLFWYVSRGLGEFFGDLCFRLPQDDARLALSLGLRFARHRVLKCLGDLHVANLHRLHGDAPGVGLLV